MLLLCKSLANVPFFFLKEVDNLGIVNWRSMGLKCSQLVTVLYDCACNELADA